jgi:ABC-type ATPase with predicted acetyltransferase domain
MKYEISQAFQTRVERSKRVLEVAEAFGLGLDEKEFVVFERLPLEIEQGHVVYITGQSGSGKSILLKQLQRAMREAGQNVANLDEIQLPDVPLVDQVGADTRTALELLSKAGLNDAYLFIRKPSELSDGQRYRLKLAHLMQTECDVWVADEFGAVLDRITAKVVAFSMQKIARSLGKTLIVATTHTDLGEELGANVTIHKRFREKVDIKVAA